MTRADTIDTDHAPAAPRTCPGLRGENRDRRCDEPIPDTAIRCPGCIARMAVDLRGGAELWPELLATVRRLTKMSAVATPTARAPRPLQGPQCAIDDECTHWTCWNIELSRMTADRLAVEEDPLPSEDTTPINLNALEVCWSAEHTYRQWAKTIRDDFKVPFPVTTPRSRRPGPALTVNPNRGPVERCPMTDLEVKPILMCGCRIHRRVD